MAMPWDYCDFAGAGRGDAEPHGAGAGADVLVLGRLEFEQRVLLRACSTDCVCIPLTRNTLKKL